jgi:DNA repair protein RAD5
LSSKKRTAIFAILTRLRQAVLHPTLVLKRLNLNIKEQRKAKGRSAEERAADQDLDSIKSLIDRYATGSGSQDDRELSLASSQVMEELLEGGDDDASECLVCQEVSPYFYRSVAQVTDVTRS